MPRIPAPTVPRFPGPTPPPTAGRRKPRVGPLGWLSAAPVCPLHRRDRRFAPEWRPRTPPVPVAAFSPVFPHPVLPRRAARRRGCVPARRDRPGEAAPHRATWTAPARRQRPVPPAGPPGRGRHPAAGAPAPRVRFRERRPAPGARLPPPCQALTGRGDPRGVPGQRPRGQPGAFALPWGAEAARPFGVSRAPAVFAALAGLSVPATVTVTGRRGVPVPPGRVRGPRQCAMAWAWARPARPAPAHPVPPVPPPWAVPGASAAAGPHASTGSPPPQGRGRAATAPDRRRCAARSARRSGCSEQDRPRRRAAHPAHARDADPANSVSAAPGRTPRPARAPQVSPATGR